MNPSDKNRNVKSETSTARQAQNPKQAPALSEAELKQVTGGALDASVPVTGSTQGAFAHMGSIK